MELATRAKVGRPHLHEVDGVPGTRLKLGSATPTERAQTEQRQHLATPGWARFLPRGSRSSGDVDVLPPLGTERVNPRPQPLGAESRPEPGIDPLDVERHQR